MNRNTVFLVTAGLVLALAAGTPRAGKLEYKIEAKDLSPLGEEMRREIAGMQYIMNPYQLKQFFALRDDAARREWMLRTAGHDTGEMEGAIVMAGSLGLERTVTMTAQFRTGEHSTTYETGVLDRDKWLVVPSGFSGYGIPQEVPEIYVGPEDKAGVVYSMTTKEELLAFYDLSSTQVSISSVNVPSAKFPLRRKHLTEPYMAVLLNLLKAVLAAFIMSVAMLFTVTGIWHFLLPRRAG